MRLPLFTSIAAFFINVSANYFFIFGKCGFPAMGAAIGTLIVRMFEFLVICSYLFFLKRIWPSGLGIYSREPKSPKTAEIARKFMRAVSMIVLSQATDSIMTKGTLHGGGDTRIRLEAACILDLCFLKIDEVWKAVWCIFRLRSGEWIKKIAAVDESGM